MQKLSDWAKQENLKYHTAYQRINRGDANLELEKVKGSLYVKPKSQPPQNISTQEKAQKSLNVVKNMAMPKAVASYNNDDYQLARGAVRRNLVSTESRFADRYANIDKSFIPYNEGQNSNNNSGIDIRDIIILTQKAYYNFAVVRQVIDIMTEFSCSDIYLTGGNAKSRRFFENYFDAINLPLFQSKFFREYYRSGNIFVYPIMGALKPKNLVELNDNFGLSLSIAKKIELPVKYVILNPADVIISGSSSFLNPTYYKKLNSYEVARLKNPQTPQDKAIFEALPDDIKRSIKNQETKKVGQSAQSVDIPLDMDKTYAIFYNKQDYEPFGVSLIFPVLDDLEWKQELKNIDKAISRTVSQAVLLVKTGYEGKEGEYNYNQAVADAYEEIFKNQSVGRVIIGDFTLDAKFVIPDIGDILTPEKYAVVNEDIRAGLNDILFGSNSEKFANQGIKVEVFMERLNKARKGFIDNFLYPEMKKIAETLNFKACPKPNFQKINLRDELQWGRLYTELLRWGGLTPAEAVKAIETGILPTEEEMSEHQTKYREERDKGFYEPITGGPNTQVKINKENNVAKNEIKKQNGRPPGSKTPQSTKNQSPIGTSKASKDTESKIHFSATKIRDNLILANEAERKIEKELKKLYKVKNLTDAQKSIAYEVAEVLISNENPENWLNKTMDYIKKPLDTNPEKVKQINDIAYEFQVNNYIASVLKASAI